jgi:outer membrane protein assembly factor BamB
MKRRKRLSRWKLRLGIVLTLLLPILPLDSAPAVPGAGTDDWTMFHHDVYHTGVSPDTTISASNASGLSLQWMTNTGARSYTSPVVAYNASLGKTLVYQGSASGTMAAYDVATGERIWYYRAGGAVTSSPAKDGNVLYFGADDKNIYALNATTGALMCGFNVGGVINSSPVVADPDGNGKVLYIGDNGYSGANDGGHFWAINAVDPNSATDCSQKWVFSGFGEPPGSATLAGSWSPATFVRDANDRPLVVFGSSSPDNSIYAVDAVTGARIWRFETEIFAPDNDVGAGTAVSPPGVNGFADGVVYGVGKNKIVYGLNLRTGAKIWEFRIRDDDPKSGGTRSSPALLRDTLYFGAGSGVYALNAVTGAKRWATTLEPMEELEIVSSPAIGGPAGDEVLYVGSLAGNVYAVAADDGANLWSYATADFIYGSGAIAQGKVYIGSADGFLYAFGLGGGASAKPDVAIASPADGSTLNPTATVAVSGTATDDSGVRKVLVAVRANFGAKWWDATTRKWTKVFTQNEVALSNPNPAGTSAGWNLSFPVSSDGGDYFLQAEAVDADGQHTAPVAISEFTVRALGNPPATDITDPIRKQVFNFASTPDREVFPITVEGTATDTGGAHPGIKQVKVIIKNVEHGEYFCGFEGCSGAIVAEFAWFRPQYTAVQATLDNPGGTTTGWSLTFPVYDHPHKYSISAFAIDDDGEIDTTKARVSPICVRDPNKNCSQI